MKHHRVVRRITGRKGSNDVNGIMKAGATAIIGVGVLGALAGAFRK